VVADDATRLGLADFLTDLRAELNRAQSLATDEPLKLGVEEINLTLDLEYTLEVSGEVSGKVKAKFWVFASAEAAAKAGVQSGRTRTQTIALTLKPWMEEVVIDEQGRQTVVKRDVNVKGKLDSHEKHPASPDSVPH
jgi:hypothetical protein